MKQEKSKQADAVKSNDKNKMPGRKNKGVVLDNTPATQKSRAKTGHGMANEGTNVSYDEER